MDVEGLVSPIGREGVTILPPRRAPRRGTVGRRPFPILDLREKDESHVPRQHQYGRAVRLLEAAYAAEAETKDDPLFHAEDAVVFRGGVWHRGAPLQGSVLARRPEEVAERTAALDDLARRGRLPRLPGVTAVISGPGERNYFHWTTEIAPRLFLLRDHVAAGGALDRILLKQPKPAPYIDEVLELFFPELAPLVQAPPGAALALETALFFTDDRFLGRAGTEPARYTRFKPPTMFMCEAAEALIGRFPRGPGRALLISRADAPTRRIVNEDALLEALAPEGLERVAFTGMPVRAQAELMAGARLVVGAHGAGLTNLMYCRPGTAVIEVTTSQYMTRCRSFADIAMYRGLRYALAVVDQHGEQWLVERNVGNDMELGARAAPAIAALAREMLGAA